MQKIRFPHNTDTPEIKSHPLYKTHKGYGKLEDTLALLGGFVILAMVLLGGSQVLSRLLFNTSVRGYIDIVEQMMIGFAFLGVAYCQRTDGHIRMDLVVNATHGRLRWGMECFTTTLAGISMVFISIGAYKHFQRSFKNGDSTIDISISLWYAKVFVFIMLLVLAMRLFIQATAYGRLLINPSLPPIALPEPETDEISEHMDDSITEDTDTNVKGV